MGRYTGPKGRINRRLNFQVFESAGAVKALDKRPGPPGPIVRRRKTSVYGQALIEKQKIKFYYGLRDKQLRKYFDMARRAKGNTGENLLLFCERRLDNVVRRAGFTLTRPQARQGIAHRHFQVNGVTVQSPSIIVRPGDVVTVRNRPNLKSLYSDLAASDMSQQATWISFDAGEMKAIVTQLPTFEDVSLPVDVGAVVAFLSR
ncbi:30S ribosomal protein S4 [Calycomorphotria hydatis]|uniref:Small ribosomal subunit protein uS4 n=1 Tax=Calycomorphotria hydatis TaxID=2528027 RepID=A0A517TE08_9PLAN|nr:30S ribosomal protein S4 [Calycomorphotria hydatis]QDT66605.1 30S ribosomal protein S4 [Calycomorphotria hydatis]